MRRLLPLLLPVLLLAACAGGPGKRGARKADGGDRYLLPSQPAIGRIVAVDTPRRTAVVALNEQGVRIPRADNWELYSRRDDLTPTARLTGTAQRFGSSLGVLIADGLPSPGDEVVLAPGPVAPAAGR